MAIVVVAVVAIVMLVAPVEVAVSFACLSWYSWKQGTMQRLVWHSGQWYLVLRRSIRPWASIVFQQKLHPNAGPGRMAGQWLDRGLSKENSRVGT